MSQVSRFRLNNDVYERIFNLYIETLISIKDRKSLKGFVENFFTPTERIMFAKRLAACVMLAKGNSYSAIRETLRISPPTIAKMSLQVKYEGKTLVSILENTLRKDAAKILLEELLGITDIQGKGKSRSAVYESRLKRAMKIQRLKKEF